MAQIRKTMKFRNQLTQRKGNRFSGSVPFLLPFAINFTAALAFYSLAPGDLLIRQQQSQWQKLVENGTREELKRFVQEHPTSPYIKVAQSRLDSLDWANARQQRTIESVSQYISLHPEGYYVDQADMLRSSLERQKAEAEAAAAALRDSLAQAGQAE